MVSNFTPEGFAPGDPWCQARVSLTRIRAANPHPNTRARLRNIRRSPSVSSARALGGRRFRQAPGTVAGSIWGRFRSFGRIIVLVRKKSSTSSRIPADIAVELSQNDCQVGK